MDLCYISGEQGLLGMINNAQEQENLCAWIKISREQESLLRVPWTSVPTTRTTGTPGAG